MRISLATLEARLARISAKQRSQAASEPYQLHCLEADRTKLAGLLEELDMAIGSLANGRHIGRWVVASRSDEPGDSLAHDQINNLLPGLLNLIVPRNRAIREEV